MKEVIIDGWVWRVTKSGPNTHLQQIRKVEETIQEPSDEVIEDEVEDRPQEENNELIAAEIKPKRKKKK